MARVGPPCVQRLEMVTGAPRPKPQCLRGALLGPGDLDDPEGIDQGEKFPRPDVPVGPPQGSVWPPVRTTGRREAADQLGVDIGDQVAEVVDRDDHAADLVRRDGWLLDPGRHDVRGLRPEIRRRCRARPASSAATGAKMSRPWKVALGIGSLNFAIARGGVETMNRTASSRAPRPVRAVHCPARGTHAPPRRRR